MPSAREPEVLSAMGTIVNKLGGHITSEVPKIFDAVFECTLEMINKDFEEYPEHRTNFFLLLQVSREYGKIDLFSPWYASFESRLKFKDYQTFTFHLSQVEEIIIFFVCEL